MVDLIQKFRKSIPLQFAQGPRCSVSNGLFTKDSRFAPNPPGGQQILCKEQSEDFRHLKLYRRFWMVLAIR